MLQPGGYIWGGYTLLLRKGGYKSGGDFFAR